MPGDANAAERGWLRVLIVGLVFTQTGVRRTRLGGRFNLSLTLAHTQVSRVHTLVVTTNY